ncbi:FimV/HubP family polar landmark protein [Tepidimonas aquatica]|uniref:FimV N-terminal domain-containing protein n=1 Tax=Tepidimonas aquatica TaxID=247482 RepID=A0A554WLF6_9BURK|nr:FimV/HubP family polar landmark protein [Tepidimonas aquatica]TSE24422.1 hypothetical protein Taqua_01568 [Tepidimonas aquatica]
MPERHPPTTPPARSWRHVALAAALSLGVASNAWALALGRVSVQSPLGEPLRAEIDIPAITDEEAATLALDIAGPERYRSASLEWTPWLRDIQLELQRRPDGRAVVLVRSDRPITEPFLDLVIVARWAGGELLRGYTLLFDPPNLRPPAPVVPMVGTPPAAPEQPAAAAPAPAAAPSPAPAPVRSTTVPSPRSPATTAPAGRRITVRRGDTAGRIAQAQRPADVTLEQMLVAMLRANPQAFIHGNVHLLKAGAVLDLPDAEAARGVDAGEARRLVAAQTRDFDAYRRRLAAAAPAQRSDAPSQQAQGSVEAAVADTKPQANTADKLTLSKPGTDDAAARVAAERQQAEQQQRAAELERNLRDLEQLRQQAQATPPAGAEPPAAPATEAPPAAPAANEPSPAPAPAAAPAAPPPPPPATPAVPAPVAPSAAPQEGPVQAVLQHPWTLPGAGAVVLLLGALAALRWRQRRRSAAADDDTAGAAAASVAAVEAEPADADTAAPADALDTDSPVDPVAEADVYLSYGRDAQAEDLLREALQADPQWLDARLKLLHILAQRHDTAGFEAEARALQPLADATTWAQVCEQGRALDPDNPLYGPGAGAADTATTTPAAAEDELPTLDLALDTVDATAQAGDSALDIDVALDSTLSADDGAPATATSPAPPADTETSPPAAPPAPAAADDDLGLDFDIDLEPAAAAPAQTPPAPATLPPEVAELSLDLPVDESTEAAPLPELPAQAPPETPGQDGNASAEPPTDQDPLETKLSLAREFEAIGDVDGARILAEEVLAEAQGELRERAQAFLAQLG